MGLLSFCWGRIRLRSCVLFIILASLVTWSFFVLQLQVKETRQAPRQALDTPSPSEEALDTPSRFEILLASTALYDDTDDSTVYASTLHPQQTNLTITGPGLLLVLIHASGNGSGRRDTIRSTWVSTEFLEHVSVVHKVRVEYRFVLGVQGIPNSLLQKVTAEAEYYGDMILLEDVTDEHATLTNRTLKSFKVVSNIYGNDFDYVLKCDDDTFVNLMEISKELLKMKSKERLFWGDFQGSSYLIRDGPYAEHHWSLCETYLPYALGGGYVLSMDVVSLLARIAPYLKIYKNEDAALGAWLSPFNIKRMSDARFNSGAISRGCKSPYILTHKINMTTMHKLYTAMVNEGYMCTPENQWFKVYGHLYNWRLQPSKCCRYSRRVP